MKPLCLLPIRVLILSSVSAQNRSKFYHIIRWSAIEKGNIKLVYKDTNGMVKRITICSSFLKGKISLSNGVPLIDSKQIKNDDYANDTSCISKNTPADRFEIDLAGRTLGDPIPTVRIPFRAWTAGISVIPIKFRGAADSSYSKVSTVLGVNASYGRTFGYSKITPAGITNYSVTVAPFIGVSSVELKKSTVKTPSSWNTEQINPVFSYGLTTTVSRNYIGLEFLLGVDNAIGRNANAWSYNKKIWFGLGVNAGLNFFRNMNSEIASFNFYHDD